MDRVASTSEIDNSTIPEPVTLPLIASWILAGVALLLIPFFHLISALIAGLLVYELVSLLAPIIERHLINRWSRLLAVVALAILTITALILAGLAITAFVKSEIKTPQALSTKLNVILTEARGQLPSFMGESFPGDADDLKTFASNWVDEHAKEIQEFGNNVLHFFARGFFGMIIGGLISVLEVTQGTNSKPLASALHERVSRFAISFRRIVFAQFQISALNTVLTGIFIFAVLPALGIHLPLSKTLIAVTFFAGLLPVIGNLISNTAIFIAGLSVSIYAGLFALIFLVVIHKLEYFFNARIVGSSIYARAWELLIAMLVMEVAFGIGGLVIAPIYYAYIKRELKDRNLV